MTWKGLALTAVTMAALGGGPASAMPITVTAVADTFVTSNNAYGGVGSNHGSDSWLAQIGDDPLGNESWGAYTLFRFDLSPYAGYTVTGDGSLTLFVASIGGPSVTQTLLVSPAHPWNEFSVTFPGPGQGGPIATQSVTLNAAPSSVTITSIDQWLIQDLMSATPIWNSLSVQSGVAPAGNEIFFYSREAGLAAELSFDATAPEPPPAPVPEPSSLLLLGSGAAVALRRLRRRA